MGGLFAKDKSAVYFGSDRLEGANPAAFHRLDPPTFGSDGNRLFCGSHPVGGVDLGTFRFMTGNTYAKDAHAVYTVYQALPFTHN